jgi:hypothetical protein
MPLNFPTFSTALEICGILQPIARNQICAQGYENVVQFATLSESNIGEFVKAMNKLPKVQVPCQPAPGDDPNADPGFDMVKVVIPFASIQKLKALRKWVLKTQRIGWEFEGELVLVVLLKHGIQLFLNLLPFFCESSLHWTLAFEISSASSSCVTSFVHSFIAINFSEKKFNRV